jgi:hypothetical protein
MSIPLPDALHELRTVLDDARFPFPVPSAGPARQTTIALRRQLDDYLLPRVKSMGAPLLTVVGGSTGAGKSTVINSVVGSVVSPSGVLRPTTRSPTLVANPGDAAWFADRRVLPALARTTAARTDHGSIRLVEAAALPPGLALLDAPDIDSVVEANRALADQLLAAADLWLFLTTAARYADAVPWAVLRSARDRGAVVALVLDRVPPHAHVEVAQDLRAMLAEQRLAKAPLFVIDETTLTRDGLLPAPAFAPLRAWLQDLAADSAARSEVIRTTLTGALAHLVSEVAGLASAAEEQVAARTELDAAAARQYDRAFRQVNDGIRDGALLRGEVLARWQEFVGTGELMRSLQTGLGKLREKVVAALTGRPSAGQDLRHALATGVAALVQEASADAAERTAKAWRATPAGREVLTDELTRPGGDITARTGALIRDWQRGVMELVRVQGAERRRVARVSAYVVNATGLVVMVAVFASTAFIPTGAEVGIAAGTTIAAQKVLEALFGDEALRRLSAIARDDLMRRVRLLMDEDAARYPAATASVAPDPALPEGLREGARGVRRAAPPSDPSERPASPAGTEGRA